MLEASRSAADVQHDVLHAHAFDFLLSQEQLPGLVQSHDATNATLCFQLLHVFFRLWLRAQVNALLVAVDPGVPPLLLLLAALHDVCNTSLTATP